MNRITRLAFAAAAFAALAACGQDEAADETAAAEPAETVEPAAVEEADAAPAALERLQAPISGCDRACLTGLMDDYLAALEAGDPSALPLAPGARMTEDQVDIAPGEGIWASDVAPAGYRFDIIDVRAKVAASLVKLMENGQPVLMAVRLITDEGEIQGVESMVVRNAEEGMIYRIDAIDTLSDAMAYTPTDAERNTRAEMVDAATRYPKGLQIGSFVESDVPFSDDAYRFENGQLMAGPGCTFFQGCEHIKEQTIPTLPDLTYRVAAVDEEQGVVLIRMDFGPGSVFASPDRPEGQSLSVFEAFKVYGGQVHAVEAFMEMKPADQPLGWNY